MRFLGLISVATIFVLGLVMIFSTSSADALDHAITGGTHLALIKQIVYFCVGACFAYGIWRVGYRNLLELSPALLLIASIILALILIPGIGKEVNGSRRWLNLGGISLQPSEFVKYIVPIFFIHQMRAFRDLSFSLKAFVKILIPLTFPLFFILVEPNNGTVAVIVMGLVLLFFLTRIPFKYWAMPLLAAALVGGLFASQLPYVSARIKVYLHPELDIRGKGHQPHQAKIAAGSGGLFGKGPGNSWQKLSYLPEAQNDYIAAIFAEEFGFLGVLLLILLYLLFALSGFAIAHQASDIEGFYIASVVTFLISFQAFLNLGVVSGLLPSTGLNLPFFSQGGSSLMANLVGVGLLHSVRDKECL